jgi:hypothetical protein
LEDGVEFEVAAERFDVALDRREPGAVSALDSGDVLLSGAEAPRDLNLREALPGAQFGQTQARSMNFFVLGVTADSLLLSAQ